MTGAHGDSPSLTTTKEQLMKKNTVVLSTLLVLVLATSASLAETVPPTAVPPSGMAEAKLMDAKAATVTTAPKEVAPPKPAPRADTLSGKVLEVINGGGYTFFLIEKGGEKFWVATPPTEGKIGEEISFQPGIEMKNFKSKSLDRTFDQIFFSGGKALPAGAVPNDDFLMKKAHSMKPAAEATPGAAATDTKAAPAAAFLTGKVLEKLDGGGYSYFLLEQEGKKTWVATPPTEGKVGDTMSFLPGGEMKDFKSKSLNKSFDSIIFSNGLALPENMKMDPELMKKKAHEGLKSATAMPVGQNGKSLDLKVEKAGGANAYTVAELYEKSGTLNGKDVVVQGKVVKVSKQIMGKNWVHLQDGSGDAATGTNNLVTTTQDIVAVGDIVTAKGKLAKDKDFGGGYQYVVIIEETTLVKK
jgi:hypothetical protein